jgi:3',5'-cyclic AMP phosphodiesterase CpdA
MHAGVAAGGGVAWTLAHISDLHVGRDEATDAAVVAVAAELAATDVDEVLVTGDVTHRGRREELARFERIFEPIRDRLVIVPGNHDRLGEDAAGVLMPGRRVDVEVRRGLYVVRVDSTAPHNARLVNSHGELTPDDLLRIRRAVDAAPRRVLVAVMLHHHVLPLRGDHLVERLATWLGLPHAAELERGAELVELLLGRCDLVLHGHRHAVTDGELHAAGGRELRIVNAGCTPDAGRVRIVSHESGRIVAERWLDTAAAATRLAAA